ncbi:hypothetical protein JHK86_010368 [Glycine max]|nr:hypothetical protein JHK86_010368 [Glycine max]
MQENECERKDAGSSAVSSKCECNCHYTHTSHFAFSKRDVWFLEDSRLAALHISVRMRYIPRKMVVTKTISAVMTRRTVLGSKTISAEDRDVTVAARGVGSPSDLLFLFGDAEQHYSLIISRPTQSRESKKKRGSEKRFSFSLVVSKKKLSVLQPFVRKMPALLTLMSNDINCITLVDYYAPLFFLEISTIQPEEFYLKVNLCQLITYIPLQVQEDTSGFCEDIVSTLLAKF